MIVYDSQKWSWFFLTLIRSFQHSYNLKFLFRFIFYSVVYTSVTTVILIHYLNASYHVDTVFFSLIGVILSLFLVFRMNTSYDRWWEGRKAWGKLINDTRTFGLMLNTLVPKEDLFRRRFFTKHTYNFCLSLSWHLRDMMDRPEYVGTKEEVAMIREAKHHPNRVASFIFGEVEKMYGEKAITDFDKNQLRLLMQGFIDVLGMCERIKKSPIPFSHTTFIKLFILIYLGILPFGLVSEFHYLTIPASMVMSFAMFGIEVVSEEVENPFGLDANDLPTGTLSETIRENLNEILDTHIRMEGDAPVHKEADILH